jgi:glutathione synthase/RimK-type ligase-like ATP-grasp enzyme
VIPGMQMALDIVIASHYKLMKDVPIVGWDVTFTPHGIFLLEVNLSCNFFRGSFDYPDYIAFVDAYWEQLDRLEGAKKYK